MRSSRAPRAIEPVGLDIGVLGVAGGLGAISEAEPGLPMVTIKPPVSMYQVIARKAGRLANFTDECRDFAAFIKKAAARGERYAREAGVAPRDVTYSDPVSRIVNGQVVFMVTIGRKR